ncbi:MAG: PAS domain S-box protein [Verrucomicrobia bacterium]|nr:PAS domain S-box protein [Verrucomicrobiota bacterium]
MDDFSRTVQIDLKLDSIEQKRRKKVFVKKRSLNTPQDDRAKKETTDLRYEELFQSIYDAAVITDGEGHILKANRRSAQFFQHSLDELHDMNIIDLIAGADASLFTHFSCDSSSDYVLIQAHCCRKDGSLFGAEIAANRMEIPHEQICFFIRNMERRNETENVLRTIRNAVNSSPTGIAVTDTAGIIHYANPSILTMWRVPGSDGMIGQNVANLCEEKEVISSMLELLQNERQPWTGELLAMPRKGGSFPVQMSTAPNTDAEDEIIGFVFAFMDISDRKRAEKAMRTAERDEAMLASLAGACHHLSQPATILMTNAALMRKECANYNGEVQSLIDAYIEAADELQRILRILNNLHQFRSARYLANTDILADYENAILDLPASLAPAD